MSKLAPGEKTTEAQNLNAIFSTSSADCEACGGVGGDQLSGDRGGSLPAQRCSVVSAVLM